MSKLKNLFKFNRGEKNKKKKTRKSDADVLQDQEAPKLAKSRGATGTPLEGYQRNPHNYDEIDIDDIQGNRETKQTQKPPPGTEGLNYVEVEVSTSQSGAMKFRNSEQVEYTSVVVDKTANGRKLSIEG